LFKPFFTTRDVGSGTGLGLVTCYRIIETWGGTIEVESKEGAGATFRLIFPKSIPIEGAIK
jgi:signal transduction histidine kinase